jgi:hypothetical protein
LRNGLASEIRASDLSTTVEDVERERILVF